MIKVLLVDDQMMIIEGLKAILNQDPNIEVIGHANHGEEALLKTNQLKPDVILMDIRMPLLNGVMATKKIKEKFPFIKILILTTFDDDAFIIEAMKYGASGYLLKDTPSHRLIQAIRDVLDNQMILPEAIASKLMNHVKTPSIKKTYSFTERERDIINLLVEGASNKDIAEELYLSVGTVKNYLSQIYLKLEVTDRSNAIIVLKNADY
jgi:DNA-binding NarL/FixJ family response regulator